MDGSHAEPVLFNSGIAISQNISVYFRMSSDAMMRVDLFAWYKYLELAYLEGEFKFKEEETADIQKRFKEINPHNKTHYQKLKDLHMVLRRYLDKHGFLMPKGDNPRLAVYR